MDSPRYHTPMIFSDINSEKTKYETFYQGYKDGVYSHEEMIEFIIWYNREKYKLTQLIKGFETTITRIHCGLDDYGNNDRAIKMFNREASLLKLELIDHES